jgi:hypothetical protein
LLEQELRYVKSIPQLALRLRVGRPAAMSPLSYSLRVTHAGDHRDQPLPKDIRERPDKERQLKPGC